MLVTDQMDMTEAGIRAQIERGLAINELVKTRIADNIKITEEESREFYDSHPELFKQPEEVKASHILIKVEPDADAARKQSGARGGADGVADVALLEEDSVFGD